VFVSLKFIKKANSWDANRTKVLYSKIGITTNN